MNNQGSIYIRGTDQLLLIRLLNNNLLSCISQATHTQKKHLLPHKNKRIQHQCRNLPPIQVGLEMLCLPTKFNSSHFKRSFVSLLPVPLFVQQTTHSVEVFHFPKFLLRRLWIYIAITFSQTGSFCNEVPCICNEFSCTRPKLFTVMDINRGILPHPRNNTVLVPRHCMYVELIKFCLP